MNDLLSAFAESQRVVAECTVWVEWERQLDGAMHYTLKGKRRDCVEDQIKTMQDRAKARGRIASFNEIISTTTGGFLVTGTERAGALV